MFIDWPTDAPSFRIYFMRIYGDMIEKSLKITNAEVIVLER